MGRERETTLTDGRALLLLKQNISWRGMNINKGSHGVVCFHVEGREGMYELIVELALTTFRKICVALKRAVLELCETQSSNSESDMSSETISTSSPNSSRLKSATVSAL